MPHNAHYLAIWCNCASSKLSKQSGGIQRTCHHGTAEQHGTATQGIIVRTPHNLSFYGLVFSWGWWMQYLAFLVVKHACPSSYLRQSYIIPIWQASVKTHFLHRKKHKKKHCWVKPTFWYQPTYLLVWLCLVTVGSYILSLHPPASSQLPPHRRSDPHTRSLCPAVSTPGISGRTTAFPTGFT